jgi:tetratricopeptide (TPR) repeat protein
MDQLDRVIELQSCGRFSEALLTLQGLMPPREQQCRAALARIELLERLGRYGESKVSAERLLKNPQVPANGRSICESALGLIAADYGETEAALIHLQRALSFAEVSNDLKQICWCQLRLLLLFADTSGPAAALQMLERARTNITKLGDPVLSAALHIFVGEMEAKRGLIQSATRHTMLGQRLLDGDLNVWLDGRAENTLLAIDILLSEFAHGISREQRALELADKSGAAGLMRACVANLGNLYYRVGEFDKALEYLERADRIFPFTGERSNGWLESLARVHISRGELAEARRCLDRITESVHVKADWLLYANRHSTFTRTQLLAREGLKLAALDSVNNVLSLSASASDELLHTSALLLRLELLGGTDSLHERAHILDEASSCLPKQPPEMCAQYERALALMPFGNSPN